MTVLVTGSRGFWNRAYVERWFLRFDKEHNRGVPHTLIQGDARGVDTWAKEICQRLGWKVISMPADWDRYGKGAGYRRNVEMVDELIGAEGTPASKLVIGFWDGQSRGTQMCLKIAREVPWLTVWVEQRSKPANKEMF